MAVDQAGCTEAGAGLLDQLGQGGMVGQVAAVEPGLGLGHGQLAAVDLGAAGHDAGHGAQARAHPRAAAVGPGGQGALEHRGIELEGLAVDVEIGARELRRHQGAAQGRGARDQLVDEGVLGTADRHGVEPAHGEERRVVEAAAVGRGNDHRQALAYRAQDRDRRAAVCGIAVVCACHPSDLD